MTQDAFNPPVGEAEELAPYLRRVLAPNPSPMTFRGTNSYLLGQGEIAVIDPGPESEAHLQALLAALRPGERITHILVTHSHVDHSPLAARLAAQTGADILAFGPSEAGRSAAMQACLDAGMSGGGEGIDTGFEPTRCLRDGERVQIGALELTALHTPGHMGNHMCFAWGDVLFCGDLVMGWASSLVSPPDGDLTDFMQSCARIRALNAKVLHSGHGAPITDPAARLEWLIAHRRGREAQILEALGNGPANARMLAEAIYTETPAPLLPAAARNVFAHLIDLKGKSQVSLEGAPDESAIFSLCGAR